MGPGGDGIRVTEAVFDEFGRRAGPLPLRSRARPAGVHYKHVAAMAVFPVQRIGPEVNPHRWNGARFELREFYCPACFTRLETEIARPDDPVVDDVELDLGWVRTEGV